MFRCAAWLLRTWQCRLLEGEWSCWCRGVLALVLLKSEDKGNQEVAGRVGALGWEPYILILQPTPQSNPCRPSPLPPLIAAPFAPLAACPVSCWPWQQSCSSEASSPTHSSIQSLPPLPLAATDCSAIRRTGRVSLVVLALAAVMLIGGLAVGGFGITIIMDAVKTGNLGTLPLCPA